MSTTGWGALMTLALAVYAVGSAWLIWRAWEDR